MVKVLLWSDLHLHNWLQCSNLVNGVNDRLLDGINVIQKIIKLSSNYDAVIFAGDLYHKRGELATIILHLLVDTLDYIPVSERSNWYWMLGNHDQDTNTNYHALKFLEHYGTVIDSPDLFVILKDQVWFSAHPWDDDRMRWRDGYLNVVGKSQGKLAFSVGHIDFRDVLYRGKAIGEAPASSLIAPDIPFFSGHYHDHIIHPPVTYIGSPMQHNWGDTLKSRGYVSLTIENGEVTTEHKPLKVAPKFVEVNCIERLESILKLHASYFIRVNSTQLSEKEKEKIKSMCHKATNVRSLTFTEEVHQVDEEEEVLPAFNESPDLSDTLEKFVQDARTDLDKKTLLKIGMELMQNVT